MELVEESDKNRIPISYSEIIPHFSNEGFVLKTQQQIAKDFAKFNLFFEDNFEKLALHSAEEIELLIEEKIVLVLQQGQARLIQLLYTIDISEKEFKSILANVGAKDFSPLLAKKILFREAYKVYLRSIF